MAKIIFYFYTFSEAQEGRGDRITSKRAVGLNLETIEVQKWDLYIG